MKIGVYLLLFDSGKHYLGSTNGLDRRIQQHRHKLVYSTSRLGKTFELVAFQSCSDLTQARRIERQYKSWKNYSKVHQAMQK